MTTIIAFSVLALCVLGLILLVSPALLLDYIRAQMGVPGFRVFAVLVRLLLGVALIVLAAESRYPTLILVIGTLSLVAGIVLAVLPRAAFLSLFTRLIDMMGPAGARLGGVLLFPLAWFLVYALL